MPWLDYSTPIGCFIAQTYAALADLEGEQTRERQGGGIDAAKRAGRPAASLRHCVTIYTQQPKINVSASSAPTLPIGYRWPQSLKAEWLQKAEYGY